MWKCRLCSRRGLSRTGLRFTVRTSTWFIGRKTGRVSLCAGASVNMATGETVHFLHDEGLGTGIGLDVRGWRRVCAGLPGMPYNSKGVKCCCVLHGKFDAHQVAWRCVLRSLHAADR